MPTRDIRECLRIHGGAYLFKNISSRLSSTLPTTVMAAASTASMSGGNSPSGTVASFFASSADRPGERASHGTSSASCLQFGRTRRAQQAAAKRVRDSIFRGLGVLNRSASQGLRGLDIDRIVQCDERLQRRVRASCAAPCRLRDWAHRTWPSTDTDCCAARSYKCPAVTVVAVARLPIGRAAERGREPKIRLRRPDRRTVHLAAQQSADGQVPGRGPSRRSAAHAAREPTSDCPDRPRPRRRRSGSTGDTRPT